MNNEGRGIDLTTDFKRVYVSITETTDKTRLLIKTVEPSELYADKKTLIYTEDPKHIEGYVNLHMHLYRESDLKIHKAKNSWVLEDTRDARYVDSTQSYKRLGHHKPVRYNPDAKESPNHMICGFFATTDPECLKVLNIFDEKYMSSIDYEIPKEFIEAYANSKGDLTYAMVQPFYSSLPPIEYGGERTIFTEYKRDKDGFIAMFPAVSYNKAMLQSQLY